LSSGTLAYDYESQITSITQGSSTVSFVYDALGRRYSRTAGGTTTVFYYDGGAVVLEKEGANWTAYYGYGNALYRRNSEYPLYDGHGSERTVTDASQSVTGTLNLDAFGNLAGSTGSSSNPYMYCGAFGYRNDADAGLALVGARYYDYQVGRFITRDTELDEHPYLYCEHDSVNVIDPSGHDGFWGGLFEVVKWATVVPKVVEWGYEIHTHLVVAEAKNNMRRMYRRWRERGGQDNGDVIKLLGPDLSDLKRLSDTTAKAIKEIYHK
jgi:RHS repeat-associated protein